ncbi:MAG: OsmC family protein [Erythrobacter sp.]
MSTTNRASARYEGFGKSGQGHISTGSGAMSEQPYGFQTRFEDDAGTNPEELIAAAHASCFTMALSFMLAEEGFMGGTLETHAEVMLEEDGDSFKVTKSALSTKGSIEDMDQSKFEELAGKAKENCPISKLLDCEITLETSFSS